MDGNQEVVLSVTAEKNKLIVAYLEDFNIKYYRIKHLKRNIWYHLTLAQKQSGENMYEVVAFILLNLIWLKI